MLGKTNSGYVNLLRSGRLMMHSHQPLNYLLLQRTETASCSWQVAQLAMERSGAICRQESRSSHQAASQWAQLDTQRSLGLTGARLKSGDKVRRRLTAALTMTMNPGARRLSIRLGQERGAAEREARKKLEFRQCTLLFFMALFSYNACILSVSYQSLYCHLSFPPGTQSAAKQTIWKWRGHLQW